MTSAEYIVAHIRSLALPGDVVVTDMQRPPYGMSSTMWIMRGSTLVWTAEVFFDKGKFSADGSSGRAVLALDELLETLTQSCRRALSEATSPASPKKRALAKQ